jgi:hypothetical protein
MKSFNNFLFQIMLENKIISFNFQKTNTLG